MSKKKEPDKVTSKNKASDNNSGIKKIFSNILLWGIILVLLSIIVTLIFVPRIKDSIWATILGIVGSGLATVGTGFIVGYAIDVKKNTVEYTKEIGNELQKIIVDKTFVRTLNDEEKLSICEKLIVPNESKRHTDIDEYMRSKSRKFLDFFDINFRTNFTVTVEVSYDESLEKYKSKYSFSYHIYKINNEYKPINIKFEKDSSLDTTIIKNDKNKVLKKVTAGECTKEKCTDTIVKEIYSYEIPQEYYRFPFLIIERNVVEYGHKHWISLNWSSLTPIRDLRYEVICKDGLIKDYYIFDNTDLYDTPEINDDRTRLVIKSTQWVDPYTGICIIVANKSDDDNFEQNSQ